MSWAPDDYCLTAAVDATGDSLSVLAADVYGRVCRTGFDTPGFCLIDLGAGASSQALRLFMIALKGQLQLLHRARLGLDLVFLSAARFDQQLTTKLHRDGGPDECFLMLGYEPSPVAAELSLADFSKCAFDRGLTPTAFLEQYNPMFTLGEQLLEPYRTVVRCFSHRHFQVLLINNSVSPYSADGTSWQGVLHTAAIHGASEALRRVVNSTMVASVPLNAPEPVSASELEEFVATAILRRRGNDKPYLEDDR